MATPVPRERPLKDNSAGLAFPLPCPVPRPLPLPTPPPVPRELPEARQALGASLPSKEDLYLPPGLRTRSER